MSAASAEPAATGARAPRIGAWRSLRRNTAGSALVVFLALQLGCIVAGLLYPDDFRYLSPDNIQVLLRSLPPLAIISVGVGLLMITGEYDLSVGAAFTLTALVMAESYLAGAPLGVAVALALATGLAVGALNAAIVLRLRITSFIATLGTMMMLRGTILFFSGAQSRPFNPGGGFEAAVAGGFGVVQAQFLWLLAIAVLAYALLERHRIGNHMYATGGSPEAANAIGVNVGRVKLMGFCLSGLAAALAGILSTTRVHSISPVQGQGYELQAIAACVIGGVALSGGRGNVLGILVGAALIYTVQDILLLTAAPGYYLDAFVGFFIVCAAVLNRWVYRED